MTIKEAYLMGFEEGREIGRLQMSLHPNDRWAESQTGEISWDESDCKTQAEEHDPTPWCSWCGDKGVTDAEAERFEAEIIEFRAAGKMRRLP